MLSTTAFLSGARWHPDHDPTIVTADFGWRAESLTESYRSRRVGPTEPSAGGRRPRGMRHRVRTSLGVLAAACVAAAVAGCGSAPAAKTVVDAAIVRGVATAEPAADPRPLAAADTGFGLDVMRAWCAQNPGQNLVFSPVHAGERARHGVPGGAGRDRQRDGRGCCDLPAGDLPGRARRRAAGPGRRRSAGLDGPGVTLSGEQPGVGRPDADHRCAAYLNAVATGYGAGLAQAPFRTDPAKAAGRDQPGDLGRDPRAHQPAGQRRACSTGVGWVLTSALYLDAKWATPFDPGKTEPGAVHAGGREAGHARRYLNGDGFRYATVRRLDRRSRSPTRAASSR